jgi:hypothetical protein
MPGLRSIATVMALCVGFLGRPAWAEPVAGDRTAGAERDRARRDRVEAALEAAQAEYLDLDFDGAITVLDAAEADAVALARPGRCEGLWELVFRQGLSRWAKGDEADAGARFELALALDPERRPLGELYGPDVTAAFLRAVQARSARIARPVPLRTRPVDAKVEIDCHAVDEAELSLRPGLHAVRVAAPGFEPWSGVVDLRAEGSIEVALEPMLDAHAPVQRSVESADADAVGPVERAQATPVIGPGDRGDPRRRSDEPTRRPVLRTWWFWTIVGSVAVTGTALGLGLGLGLREPSPGRLVIVAR